MVFSTYCQFLEFWIQDNDSETKAVVKVFFCERDAQLILYVVPF